MKDTSKLFTEPQAIGVLSKFAKSLDTNDAKRLEDDIKFAKALHKHNYHLTDLEFYYRIGFALAVEWTRANLTAKPRRNFMTGQFMTNLYEPERSAYGVNLPSDGYTPKEVRVKLTDSPLAATRAIRVMPSGEVLANWEAQVEARRLGYSLGWQDGSDHIRYAADLRTVTTKEDVERERLAALAATHARGEYLSTTKDATERYYDDCIANGKTPQPVKFQ